MWAESTNDEETGCETSAVWHDSALSVINPDMGPSRSVAPANESSQAITASSIPESHNRVSIRETIEARPIR